MNKHTELRTWIEIDKKIIHHNCKTFRNLIPKNCMMMGIVKSNAYGHDFRAFSKELSEIGIDWLGVDSITEALALRRAQIKKPILVLGFTLPERFAEAAKRKISLTISSIEALEMLKKYTGEEEIRIHLKIDTGMHRQGILLKDTTKAIKIILVLNSKIKLEGIYTHFASAKNPKDNKYTIKQIAEFKKTIELFKKNKLKPIVHAAATGATMIYPESHFDMIRVGIGLYGLWPSPELNGPWKKRINLSPVLSFKTIISEVKKLPKGSAIGYDSTETLKKDSTIAICPVGYWHGLPRSLSSIGYFLVKAEKCKIIGRVSMDMTIIDVSGVSNPKIGDVVTIIGRDGGQEITADELAKLAGTINYEIVTRLNPLMRRIYI